MKFTKELLIELLKFYAVIALVPSAFFAPSFEPAYWIVLYLVTLIGLLFLHWAVNHLFERMNWVMPPPQRRRARVKKKKKSRP